MDPVSISLSVVGIVGLLAGGGSYLKGKSEADELTKKLARIKEENDKLIQQGNKSGAADSARLREQEAEIKRLKGAAADSEKEAQRLNKLSAEQTAKITALTKQNEELTGSVRAAEELAQRARTEATEAAEAAKNASAVATNTDELNAVRKSLEEAQLTAQIAEEEVSKFKAQLDEVKTALTAAVAERDASLASLTAVQAEVASIREELGTAQVEIGRIQAELEQATSERDTARAERETLEKDQDTRFQRLQEFAEKQVGKLQEENRTLREAAANAPAAATGSDASLKAVAAVAPVAIFLADEKGAWTFASDAWSKMTGATNSAEWLKSVFETDRSGVQDAWKQAVDKKTAFQKSFRLVTPNGALRWVSAKAQTTESGFVGVIEDVTEFRRIEEGMKSANLCLRSVVEAAMEGIVLLNKRGDITSWNRAAARMFGYTEEEARGRNLTALLVPDDRPTLKKGLEAAAAAVANNEPQAMEVLALCKEGTSLPIEVSVAAWAGGDVDGDLYFTATMRDVTERRQAEDFRRAKETAEESNRAKSQFLANMSHELRTPLNAIIGFSEILHDRTFGDLTPKQDRYVGNILQSGRHLLQLINDILDLSKVEAGHTKLEYVAFPVAVAVRNIENMVKVLLSKKSIKFEVDVSTDLPVVIADQAKFKQIIYNLVSNAIKFTPDGGKVTVTAWAVDNGTTLQVAVKDTGIGIKPEDQERVFKEFEQVDNSYARQQQGTGLGLALVRQFVHMHGGKISVFSEGEGKGTTFTFMIPFAPPEEKPTPVTAAPAPVAAVPVAPEVAPRGEQPVVLVVEDDQNASELLTHHLQMAGYSVSRTGSGKEALDLAKQLKPNVITLDVQLTDGDGWEVLSGLKADDSTRNIPVIMVSIVEDRDRATAMGVVDSFTKPVVKDRLLNAIAQCVQGNGAAAPTNGSGVYPVATVSNDVVASAGTTPAAANGKRNARSRG